MYQVSDLGRIKSLYINRVLKLQIQKNGYAIIDLHKNGTFKRKSIHRLVAETFIPIIKDKYYINHKDGNKLNNRADNLEWCTQSENIKYAYDNKTKVPPNMKAIKQYSMDHDILEIYNSIQEASRITKVCATNISKCCRKLRNQAGGYKWEYVE